MSSGAPGQQQLDAILAELMRAVDAGQSVDRDDWIKQHPEFAEELTYFFERNDRVEQLVRPLHQANNALHVRCPHCFNPIELLNDAELTDISCPSCGSSFSLADDSDNTHVAGVTESFGRFELLERVGAGQFGTVWKARDTELDRFVAIKVPRKGHLSIVETELFLRDARSAAQLTHPNIVGVHEVGKQEDKIYIISDFVQGATLKEWTTARKPAPREAARLCITIAEALHHAHECGVIHRDVKPGNIMMDAEGEPYIVDFGLAKREAGEITMTVEGQILGTPAYMSPEQARGKGHSVDRRADVYSLGVVLFELLTNELPFRGDSRMLIVQIVNDDPPSPRKLNARIAHDLETICLKCLRKEPERRYDSALALAEDLTRYLAGEPIHARPIGRVERAIKWAQRKPTLASLIAVSSLALVLIFLGLIVSHSLIRAEVGRTKTALTRVERAQRDTQLALIESHLEQARAARWSRRAGQRFDSLDALAKAATLVAELGLGDNKLLELRNEAIACMSLADARVVKQWNGVLHPTLLDAVAFDSGLKHYVQAVDDGGVSIRTVAYDSEVSLLPSVGGSATFAQMSPNSRYLAIQYRSGSSCLWDLRTSQQVFTAPDPAWKTIHFSKDSTLLAVASGNRIQVVTTATGEVVKSLPALSNPLHVRFHPTRNLLAMSSRSVPSVQVWDFETAMLVRTISFPTAQVVIDWSRDGAFLAGGCKDWRIYVWDMDKSDQHTVLKGHRDVVQSVAFHPTADVLASVSWDGTTRFWNPMTGKELFSAKSLFVRFSVDGMQAAFSTGEKIGLWDLVLPVESRHMYGHERAQAKVLSADISPRGNLIATGGVDGVRIWNAHTLREDAFIPLRLAWAGLRFDPRDGSLLTCGFNGLLRWSIRDESKDGVTTLRLGPAERLALPGNSVPFTLDTTGDGSTIAVDLHNSDDCVVLAAPDRARVIKSTGRYVTLSPDSKWLATGNWKQAGAGIYDVTTGEVVAQLPTEGSTSVTFSPDNKWLITGSPVRYTIWAVGSWESRHVIPSDGTSLPGQMAFSANGRLLAVVRSRHTIQLIETGSWRELARLEATPSPARIESLRFSADGGQLIAACGNEGLRLWDLRAIRKQLRRIGLDWRQPSYPADAGSQDLHARVIVELGDVAVARSDPATTIRRSRRRVLATMLIRAAHEHMRAARLLVSEKHYAAARVEWGEALGLANRALKVDPNGSRFYLQRSQIHEAMGKPQLALTDLDSEIQRTAPSVSLYWRRARLRQACGKSADSIEDYTAIIRLQPKNHSAHLARARAFTQLGKHKRAIEDCTSAIELQPNSFTSIARRAELQCIVGNYTAAVADFTKVLELSPSNGRARANLAWVLLVGPSETRDSNRALAEAELAVELMPKSQAAMNTLGVAYYRQKRFPDAIKTLLEAQQLTMMPLANPGFNSFFLALSYQATGETAKANETYGKAIAQKDKSPHGKQLWARELRTIRKEAETVFEPPTPPRVLDPDAGNSAPARSACISRSEGSTNY